VSKLTGELFTESAFRSWTNDLTDDTEYFAKAYIKNSAGITYSEEVSFRTEKVSIQEQTTISNITVSPNPTSATTTVSIDLETSGHLTVSLNNLLGQELLEVHSGFVDSGAFSRTFSISSLPSGVYYLKIIHNGNARMEMVVRE
jgi:hypothetical protein